ncbi:MAG TPA: nucleotidyltransferase family protein, partial [Allocoleopsis sp.]
DKIYNRLTVSTEQIIDFCQTWRITELAIFGSILRDDFNLMSDIDLLVTFSPDADWGLLDLMNMIEILEKLFNRPVDLVSKKAIENSYNWIRRNHILANAEVIYES